MTQFRVMIECPDGVMKWLPKDLLDGTTNLQTKAGRAYLASEVLKMVAEQKGRIEYEAANPEPVETCERLCGKHQDGHNCFAKENEYLEIKGNSAYTSCSICGFPISAG